MVWFALAACLGLAVAMTAMARSMLMSARTEHRLRQYRGMIESVTDDLSRDDAREDRHGTNHQKHSEPRSATNE